MVKVILFDLGGVLFQDFFSGGAEFFAQKFDLPLEKVSAVYEETDSALYCKDQMTDEERWENFADGIGAQRRLVPSFIQTFYASYQLFPESVAFLNKLKQEFSYIRLGILSDQPLGVTRYLRQQFSDVFSLFNEEITIISAEVLLSKKDKNGKIYQEAINRAGVTPEDILFVDNSLSNVEHSVATGMKGFFFDIHTKKISQLTEEIEAFLVG